MAYWDWTPEQQRSARLASVVAGIGFVALVGLRIAGAIEPYTYTQPRLSNEERLKRLADPSFYERSMLEDDIPEFNTR
jgi:hypothetical protein